MNDYFDCENICRACLNNIEDEKISLFDKSVLLNDFQLHEVLEACTSVQVSFSEKISIYLCEKCFQLLEISFKFRIQCILSEQKFKTVLLVQKFNSNFNDQEIKQEICYDDVSKLIDNSSIENNEASFIEIKNESSTSYQKENIDDECISVKSEINSIENCAAKNDEDSEINENHLNDFLDNTVKNEKIENKTSVKTVKLQKIQKLSFKCHTCIQYFRTKNEVISHIRNIHEDTVYECNECNKVFSKAWRLEKHKLLHGYNCKVCFRNFDTQADLNKHSEEHLEHGKFACKECGADFNKKYSLVLHTRKQHTGEKPHLCSVCGRGFADERYLTTHMRIHDGEKPYECNVCYAKFRQWSTLKGHLTTHTTEKNYICSICGKKLAYKSTLRIHMLSHTGEKKYPCLICGKNFKVSSSRSRHMKIHSGEKNYKCLECGKTFSRAHHLTVHNRIHTGEKPHVCSICGRGFIQLHVLNTHLKTHKNK